MAEWRYEVRNFKIFLWIFVVFLIQTVIAARIHVFGAVLSPVLAYVMCVAVLENEFRNAVAISIICAAAMGALSGRDFSLTVLFYSYTSIIVFALRKKSAHISNFLKVVISTFVLSALFEVIICILRTMTVDMSVLTNNALPTAVFNAVFVMIIYPILKKTMYKEEKKKLLIS